MQKELTQIKALAEKGKHWTTDAKALEIFGQILDVANGEDARTLSEKPTVTAAKKKPK